MNELSIQLKLLLDNYPLLKTIKKEEAENFVKNTFDYGYKILYPDIDDQVKYKSELEALTRKEITNQINELKEKLDDNEVGLKLDNLSNILEKFLGLSNNSNKKGEITEDIIYQILTTKYKDLSYEKTRHIPHSGDGILIFPNKLKTLVEIKNYTNTVKKEEIDKFEYDLKFNNINFGLFISLKSSIQGHSQLSYQKMIHNDKEYHMIFLSHVSNEMSKIDAAMLVLNRLFELNNNEINKTKLDWIQNQINSHFKELVKVSERTTFLKDQFLSMETNIKDNLNNYYTIIRDYQYEIDQKINQIWFKMNSDFGKAEDELVKQTIYDNILKSYQDDKSFHILTKLFDILMNYGINLKIMNEKNWILDKKNEEIGEIKKTKSKTIISLNNPNIDLIFVRNKDDENDINIKFLNQILSNNNL
tara:strand:- start:940 stop:2193 length:1254 start_codon:yes stop_codon:yes gene_type:complete